MPQIKPILQPTQSCLPGPIKVPSHFFLGLWHPLFLHSSRSQSCLMLALTAFAQNLLGSPFHAVCVMCLRGSQLQSQPWTLSHRRVLGRRLWTRCSVFSKSPPGASTIILRHSCEPSHSMRLVDHFLYSGNSKLWPCNCAEYLCSILFILVHICWMRTGFLAQWMLRTVHPN